jgi:hypothetical protein
MYQPLDYDDWMEYGKGWLALCELAIRIPGESVGSDIEEGWARELNIPVHYDINDLERRELKLCNHTTLPDVRLKLTT